MPIPHLSVRGIGWDDTAMLNKKGQMQSSLHSWEMTFSSSCRLLWSFLGSSLGIPLAWKMDAWTSGRTNGPLESGGHLCGAFPTHLDQDQVTDPGRTPCRVKEVVQMGAGHIQVENAVPFKRPLSGLCCRWRLGQLQVKAGSAERRGPGCGTAVEGRSWLQAGSQMPVPTVRGGSEGVPQTDQRKWRVLVDSRGPRLMPRSLQGRVGIQAEKLDNRCHFLQQPGAGSPTGSGSWKWGSGKPDCGYWKWSSTLARLGSKWGDELSGGLEGPWETDGLWESLRQVSDSPGEAQPQCTLSIRLPRRPY